MTITVVIVVFGGVGGRLHWRKGVGENNCGCQKTKWDGNDTGDWFLAHDSTNTTLAKKNAYYLSMSTDYPVSNFFW